MTLLTCAAIIVVLGVSANAAEVEHLGQPCRAKNILSGRVVKDRSSDREWLVLANTNEESHVELLFIDFANDTGKVFKAPAGAGAWALNEVAGDRLAVGTHYDGQFMIFDLKKMEFIKTIGFPGESYIWNFALGGDGRLYGGTYGGGKLGALDLNTYTVEDCGAPAPPNMYLRYVSPLPDGRIFCYFGMEKPTFLIYDPATKKYEPAPKSLEGIQLGTVWNGYFVAGAKAYQGKSLDPVDPLPFPAPPADKGSWTVDSYMTTPDTLYLYQGNARYRFRNGDKALEMIADISLRSGRVIAGAGKGELVGVRGQDYFVIKPGDKDIKLKPIPVESSPRPVMFLRVDPQGRLWGGPHFGQTLFWMDPKTKKVVNTSNICDAGGEVYDVTFYKGKTYAVSYAGGDIVCYNPEEAWDQWGRKNPVVLGDVGDRGYIRPVAGVMVGPDGKLYSGWMAKYGTYGGAVAITDPETGATELIENPLGEQAINGVAADGRFIYIGSSLGANGLPNKKDDSAKFGMIDIVSRKLVFDRTFDKAANVRIFGYDPKAKRVTLAVNGKLWFFDPEKKELVESSGDVPAVAGHSIASPGDGKVYYGNEANVVSVDIASGKAEQLAVMPANVTNTAVGPDGTVYATCGVDVYAIHKKN